MCEGLFDLFVTGVCEVVDSSALDDETFWGEGLF